MHLQIHSVAGIELGEIQHYPADKSDSGEFWIRKLRVTCGELDDNSIMLFSNTADGLLTPEEKAEEAMVCAMAEQAAQEGGILFAKEEDVPF